MSQTERRFRSLALKVAAALLLVGGISLSSPLVLSHAYGMVIGPTGSCSVANCPDGSGCSASGPLPCSCSCNAGGGASCSCGGGADPAPVDPWIA